jgi:P-type conjugative transfer protein TrbJ
VKSSCMTEWAKACSGTTKKQNLLNGGSRQNLRLNLQVFADRGSANSATHLLAAAGVIVLSLFIAVPTASADLLVFDPANYAQNVLTAARELQQVDNEIASLQNQAQMLINQARNLASLPYSALAQLQASIAQTRDLLSQAQNIAYDVQQIQNAFSTTYAPANASLSSLALITGAETRWRNAVGGLEDALKVQAGVVGNLGTSQTQMSALLGASQSATGALQATQAGNQLLALQSQQLADLTATVAAQGRAQALEDAQREAAEDQAREQLRRFLTYGAGYQPTAITMFH